MCRLLLGLLCACLIFIFRYSRTQAIRNTFTVTRLVQLGSETDGSNRLFICQTRAVHAAPRTSFSGEADTFECVSQQSTESGMSVLPVQVPSKLLLGSMMHASVRSKNWNTHITSRDGRWKAHWEWHCTGGVSVIVQVLQRKGDQICMIHLQVCCVVLCCVVLCCGCVDVCGCVWMCADACSICGFETLNMV